MVSCARPRHKKRNKSGHTQECERRTTGCQRILQFLREPEVKFNLDPKQIIVMLIMEYEWIMTYKWPKDRILQFYLLVEGFIAAGILIDWNKSSYHIICVTKLLPFLGHIIELANFTISVMPDKWKMEYTVKCLTTSGKSPLKAKQSLKSKLNWYAAARRSMLAMFEGVHADIRKERHPLQQPYDTAKRRKVQYHAGLELARGTALFDLARMHLRAPIDATVVAFDVSIVIGEVKYTTNTPEWTEKLRLKAVRREMEGGLARIRTIHVCA